MGSSKELLNIVDESGAIIGTATRERIHKEGLLHREIDIWFYTAKKEIIFQKRGPNKDTYPNLLTTTIGGHVDVGMSFDEAAIKEVKEEAGLSLRPGELKLYQMPRLDWVDPTTTARNNVIKALYVYKYLGRIEDLAIEKKEGQGFEAWPIYKLKKLKNAESSRFIPGLIEWSMPLFELIEAGKV